MTVDAEGLIREQPVRVAMSRMAAGLRGTALVVGAPAAVLGSYALPAWGWLAVAVVVTCAWTAVYVWICWIRYLRAWMIAVDVTLVSVLCLFLGELVPQAAVAGGANWVAGLASLTVICAQLAGTPLLSIPAGLLVTLSLAAGQSLAGVPDGGIAQGVVLAVQTFAAAATMGVATRTGRAAAKAYTRLQDEAREYQIGLAERADKRAQARLLHNGPVTTLAMALHATSSRPSEILRRNAASDLRNLSRPAPGLEEERERLVRLDDRLGQVVSWHEHQVAVTAELPPVSVPTTVAEAFAQATRELLENVARHAGTGRATLILQEYGGHIRVTVSDDGPGFDPRVQGFGLREAVSGSMTAAGGSATIRTAPGVGTTVCLEWRCEE